MHIFPIFVNKCQKQLYNEADIVACTCSFHKILKFTKEYMCYKVTLILIFARQVTKPQNVTSLCVA